MKICFVKQTYVPEFTYKSHQWTNENDLIDMFVHRVQNFGFACQTKADIWVVEDGKYISDTYRDLKKTRPDAVKELHKNLTAVSLDTVPWEEYNIVISMDSILSDDLILKYPKILWCYYEQEHVKGSFKKSAITPFGKYDLFLNHALNSKTTSKTLPTALNFPYLTSRVAFNKVITTRRRRKRLYLDSHCIRTGKGKDATTIPDLETFRNKLSVDLDMPISHCKVWNFGSSYIEVAKGTPSTPKEYINELASCKYFLINRTRCIGQAVPEAAAMGVIVLASQNKYASLICHPETKIESLSSARATDYKATVEVIKRLQDNPELQHEIIEYQYVKAKKFFLNGPLDTLLDYADLKRR